MNLEQQLMALTNSVQALVEMQAKNEEMQAKNEARFAQMATIQAGTDQQFRKLTELVEDIAEGTARLLHTAQSHERRISDLEEENHAQ